MFPVNIMEPDEDFGETRGVSTLIKFSPENSDGPMKVACKSTRWAPDPVLNGFEMIPINGRTYIMGYFG